MKKLMLLALLSAGAAAQDIFNDGDWLLVCDNGNSCRAVGYQAAGDENLPVAVLFTRAPGAPVKGEVAFNGKDGDKAQLPEINLTVNGRDLGSLKPDKSSGKASLSAEQTAALLEALKEKGATVKFAGGGQNWLLSANGAAAVLEKLAAAKDEAAALPVIKAVSVADADPSYVEVGTDEYKRLNRLLDPDNACESADGDSKDKDLRLAIYPMDGQHRLVARLCSWGAYNEIFRFGLFDGQLQRRLQLVGEGVDDEPLNEYKAGRISGFMREQASGNCGAGVQYQWDGKEFQLARRWSNGLCRAFDAAPWQLPSFVSELEDK